MEDFDEVTSQNLSELDFYKAGPKPRSPDGEEGYVSSDFGADSEDTLRDVTFEGIRKDVVCGTKEGSLVEGDGSVASLDRLSTTDDTHTLSNHSSLAYGFIPKGCYEHPIKNGAILGSESFMNTLQSFTSVLIPNT